MDLLQWTVVPTPLEDTYEFIIEADFTTWVPVPVVTIEPNKIDLEQIRQLGALTIVFNISERPLHALL